MPTMKNRLTVDLEVTKWNTYEEANGARIFSHLNTLWLKEVIKDTIMEKVNIAYDPGAPESFKFRHEYLRGQLEILNYLLECSESAKEQSAAPDTSSV